jgi:hypothetical protein
MRKKVLILIAAVVLIGGFCVYQYIFHGHRDVSTEDSAFTLTVQQLQNEFVQNDSLANAKYADQTIEVAGVITSVDASTNTIVVDEKLSAVLVDKSTKLSPQAKIKIKGRFVGYDDLLEELKMDQASVLK